MASKSDTALLADRLHSAAIHLLRGVRREDSSSGLPPAQLSALSVLVFGGGRTLGGLAEAEQVRPPTMSRIVSALDKAGLVTRTPDARDARSPVIDATAEGRRLLVEGRRRRVVALEKRLRGLTPHELATLHAAAAALVKLSGAPEPRAPTKVRTAGRPRRG